MEPDIQNSLTWGSVVLKTHTQHVRELKSASLLTHLDAGLKLVPADSVVVEQCMEGGRSRRSHHLCIGCFHRVLSAPVTIFPHSWFLKIRVGQFSQDKTHTWTAVQLHPLIYQHLRPAEDAKWKDKLLISNTGICHPYVLISVKRGLGHQCLPNSACGGQVPDLRLKNPAVGGRHHISTEEDDGQVQICPISDLRQATASRDRDGQDPCQAHLQLSDAPARVVLATPAAPRGPQASKGYHRVNYPVM